MKESYEFLHVTGELNIRIPALPRPTLSQLRAKNELIMRIDRDVSPDNEPVILRLATVLCDEDGDSISGEEYQRRLMLSTSRFPGYQQCAWLMAHQNDPELRALFGKVFIDFPGLTTISNRGERRIPYCFGGSESFEQGWWWLDRTFGRNGRVAVVVR